MNLTEELKKVKIVPVVTIEDADGAVPLAKALSGGKIPCAEVTFRTKAAAESIRRMRETCPEMLVGAGTILTCEQAEEAIRSGASFIVSPGLNPETVRYCLEKGIPVYPGVATASEIEQALSLGLQTVKFFPAEVNGGVKAIKAYSAPYQDVTFMPTGGIHEHNICEYLSCPQVIACGGSWMVQPEMIAGQKFEEIKKICLRARALVDEI